MSGDWKEAQDRIVKLPEDDSDTFKCYVHLLYTNTLSVIPDPLPPNYQVFQEQQDLAKLYVLVEKLQDTGTKNTCFTLYADVSRKTWRWPLVRPGRQDDKHSVRRNYVGLTNAQAYGGLLHLSRLRTIIQMN
jgi:hypothetical protein